MLPFPIHSPIKNQQITSIPTIVRKVASLTVSSLKVIFWMLLTAFVALFMATAISLGAGGASSTLAYRQKVLALGLTTSSTTETVGDSRADACFRKAAIFIGILSLKVLYQAL